MHNTYACMLRLRTMVEIVALYVYPEAHLFSIIVVQIRKSDNLKQPRILLKKAGPTMT
jgi:hypothetical protein